MKEKVYKGYATLDGLFFQDPPDDSAYYQDEFFHAKLIIDLNKSITEEKKDGD